VRYFALMFAALVCLLAAKCNPLPVVPTPATGGAQSVGGSSALGGALQGGATASLGGASTSGGSSAAGGSTVTPATVVACPEFIEPTCATSGTILSPERKAALKRKLTGWRPSANHAQVRRWRPSYTVLPVCSVFWTPNNLIPFSQRRGSCTANAVGGVLSTQPFTARLTQDDVDERIYPLATTIDEFPNSWPPEDTGSSGVAAWRAAVQLGYTDISSTAISSLEELQSALQKTSCFVGVDWYDSMFTPTRCGELTISGPSVGGHEVQIIGINLSAKKVWIRNSWSLDWGLSRGNEQGGYAYFSFGTLQKLLNAGGELDCPAHPPI
jgi:hypothetical protein